jgi:hypothetical protein
MATPAQLRQSKLRKVLAEGEATVGTYEPLTSATPVIPVIGFPTATIDRGKGMIDRTATMDGQAGDNASIRGSSAWTVPLEMELHDSPVKYNYWVQFLLACGFEGVEAPNFPNPGQDTFALSPSTLTYANFDSTNVDHPPTTMSVSIIQNNNQVSPLGDYVMRTRGFTGVASFNLTTGDIAKMSVAGKALVVDAVLDDDDFLDNSDPAVALEGDAPNTWATPYVCKAITLTITDAGSNVRDLCLQSIAINMNSNHPDFECPTEEYGFDISPVLMDTSPTVDLVFPDGDQAQPWVFAQFRSGAIFTVQAELASSTGRTLKFTFPQLQFQSVTLGDSGGFVNYTITAKAIRNPGDVGNNIMSIDWLYNP